MERTASTLKAKEQTAPVSAATAEVGPVYIRERSEDYSRSLPQLSQKPSSDLSPMEEGKRFTGGKVLINSHGHPKILKPCCLFIGDETHGRPRSSYKISLKVQKQMLPSFILVQFWNNSTDVSEVTPNLSPVKAELDHSPFVCLSATVLSGRCTITIPYGEGWILDAAMLSCQDTAKEIVASSNCRVGEVSLCAGNTTFMDRKLVSLLCCFVVAVVFKGANILSSRKLKLPVDWIWRRRQRESHPRFKCVSVLENYIKQDSIASG